MSKANGAVSPLIHVVDDDAAVRESLQALLESYDYGVCAYASAPEFLLADGAARRGCLIADLHMPGMNGIELLDALRRDGEMLPAIVMTGRGDSILRQQALKAGAFALLDKPVNGDELLTIIDAALAADPSA
jgi:two-component system, LuxR family, response regulator FixJ